MSCGTSGPSTSGVAGRDVVAGVDAQVLAVRDQVLALDAALVADDDRPLAAPLLVRAARRVPSISAMTAGSFGLRASKISVTRGRPPVMSCVPATSRGVLASSVPAVICLAFVDLDVGPLGHVVDVEDLALGRPR